MKLFAIVMCLGFITIPSCNTKRPPRPTPGDVAVMQRRAAEVAALREVAAHLRANPNTTGQEARDMLGKGVQAASTQVSEPWMKRLNDAVGLRPGDSPDVERWDSAQAAALFESFANEHEASSLTPKPKRRR